MTTTKQPFNHFFVLAGIVLWNSTNILHNFDFFSLPCPVLFLVRQLMAALKLSTQYTILQIVYLKINEIEISLNAHTFFSCNNLVAWSPLEQPQSFAEPRRFDVLSVNGVQQCDCWSGITISRRSLKCLVSGLVRFLPVSPMLGP